MKNWFNGHLAFTKYLWFRLAVGFTILTFIAMTLLIVILYGLDDYKDFRSTLSLENIKERVTSEKLTIAQAILDTENSEWRNKARNNIRDKLTNLESGNDNTIYRITSSSRPEVYLQIVDKSDRLVISDPVNFPENIATHFTAQKVQSTEEEKVIWLRKNGPIWVDMPITNGHNEIIGRLRLLYVAEFNFLVQLRSLLHFLGFVWILVFILSVPIGIACGILAAKYVKSQLHTMNEVTERWRHGKFDVRIELPNDDVLLTHSQHLNDMAKDLESFLSLKQNLAVSDAHTQLARELHDTVKQKLFALGLQLATSKSKPDLNEAREHIVEAETITREAQHDIMEIITQLRHAGTSKISLPERIDTIADDFKRRFKLDIELSHAEALRCSAHTEHHLQRIVQEALMNAVRHGKASKVVISCQIVQDTATLTITDNGRGFNTENKTAGFGLTSMKDRGLDLPQGTIEIKSSVGSGTRIEVSWRNET